MDLYEICTNSFIFYIDTPMEWVCIYSAAILAVVVWIIWYIIWHFVWSTKQKDKIECMNEELKHLVKVYNEDTGELHKKNADLHAENVKLVVKLRDAETNMISYRTKIKSIETDNIRLKECKCKKHCENNKPVVKNEQPKKKIWRPKKN